jgi:hypothetical protein
MAGKGQNQSKVPLSAELAGDLVRYLVPRGLDADPQYIGNQRAHVLGRASDVADRAPGLSAY